MMEEEDYYPTRCEIELVEKNKATLLAKVEGEFNLVDLGAGDGTKSMVVLKEALRKGRKVVYLPIDISKGSNEHLATLLRK